MIENESASKRHLTLDVVRGVAVMGILLANIAAFALPGAAYFSPMAWGGHAGGDLIAWLSTYVIVEGKMRGLFSFLFGASMLLIIERARASGESPARVHFSRMAVLFLFGVAHGYLIWWGDILSHYALVGAIAFMFVRMRAEQLFAAAMTTLVLTLVWNGLGFMTLLESAARNTVDAIDTWTQFSKAFGTPPAEIVTKEIAAMRGPWLTEVAFRWGHVDNPFIGLKIYGIETLAAVLFGMWGYRSGFVTGSWDKARYCRIARACLGVTWGAYLLMGLATISHGFDQRWVFFGSVVGTIPFRILGTIGYAALIILALKPGGWLTERLAAVGRAAFSNYLGTSILVSSIFYGWGFGQFARWDRAVIYIVPPIVWAIMLLWSKPWLERFRYGPFEWAWRSLARLEVQPMRRPMPATATG